MTDDWAAHSGATDGAGDRNASGDGTTGIPDHLTPTIGPTYQG